MSKCIFPAVALCLVLFVMPVLAEPPYEAGKEPTDAVVSEPLESQEASIQSVCTATCQYGSDVTCTGSSCTAVDQNCPSQRGYCTGSTGKKWCQKCPCTAYATCNPSGYVSCGGTSCYELDGCWAMCDGEQTWCSNPDPWCPF